MPLTPASETVALAQFKPRGGKAIPVHFNPASLQYTIANTLNQKDPNNRNSVQFVSQTTAKLTMDLVFDTTMTGIDVRETTDQMAKLLRPDPDKESGAKVPPSVEFSWGAYTFTGIVEQYKETLDFFSAGGVPLRSAINLTLSSNDVVFESGKNPRASVDGQSGDEPIVISASVGAASVANALGDPRAARAIASASASASLRFSGGASLAIGGSVSLSAPAAFAAGGGIGFGAGIGGGIGLGAGAGAALGVEATAGSAFTGLRVATGAAASNGVSNSRALLPAASVSSGGRAGFDLGGAARSQTGGSLSADVGATADLNVRIGFND